jgi:Gram-negative bacterial TonB protein C-terminal
MSGLRLAGPLPPVRRGSVCGAPAGGLVAVDDWNLDAFRELDDQPALPFDAAAPADEPARQSRCTSCGDLADGALCVACERAFRLAAEQMVIEESPVAAVEQPAVTMVEEPRALAVEALAASAVEPPAVSVVEPPAAMSAVELPAVSAVEPPAVSVVEPPVVSVVEPPVVSVVEPPVVSVVEPPPVLTPNSLTVTAPPLEELFAALEKVQRDASAAIASSAPVVEPPAVNEVEPPVDEHSAFEPPVDEHSAFEPPAVSTLEPLGMSGVEPPAVSGVERPAVSGVEPPALDTPAVVALPASASDPFVSDFAFDAEPPAVSGVEPPARVASDFDVSEFAIDADERSAPVVVAPAAPVVQPAPVFEKAERAIAETKAETIRDVPVVKPVIAETVKAVDVPRFDQAVAAKSVVANPVVKNPVAKTPVIESKPAAAAKPAAKPAVRETAVISAPVSSGSSARYIGVAAAIIVVIGAIGIPMGRMFPRTQATTEVVQPAPAPVARTTTPAPAPRVERTLAREASPVAVEPPVAPPPSRIVEAPKPHAAAAAPVTVPPPAPALAATPPPDHVEPKPAAPTRSAITPPAFALPAATAAVEPGALAAPPEPVAVKPATPAVPEPAAAPRPAAPPSGPFYEAMDVDEAPQVATRIEPRIADDLQAHLVKEIVIVRVLVSEAGHPVLVRLLRASRSGRALDAAIVAAVQQWTFTPASKRGQRVTCWLHTAVTIGK